MLFSIIHLQYVLQLNILPPPPKKEKDMGSIKEVIERMTISFEGSGKCL